jgi:hypothetical protein
MEVLAMLRENSRSRPFSSMIVVAGQVRGHLAFVTFDPVKYNTEKFPVVHPSIAIIHVWTTMK